MNNLKASLFQSVACTVIFAVVFGIVVSCGGGKALQPSTSGGALGQSVISGLVMLSKPNMIAHPALQAGTPVLAALFQTTGASSPLAQSFQGDAVPAQITQMSTQTTGFIAIGSNESHPSGIFAQIGNSTDTSGKTWPVIGFPIFQNGTLSALVVSGLTSNNTRVRCSDLKSTAAVTDGQVVEPWLDMASGSISLAVGSTTMPLTCSLNTPASNISFVSVYWAKT